MTVSDKIATELFQDKSLFSIYRKSSSYAENGLDKWIKRLAAFLLLLLAGYVPLSGRDLFPTAARSVVSWLEIGFNYSITILGFLVAGFTIFATMTKVEIFIALTMANHKAQNVSHIRFIFYSFMRVFINHIVLLFMCVITQMLRDSSPIYLAALGSNTSLVVGIKKVAVIILLPLIGYLLIDAMLQLKTFVWNLYQSVIVAIAGAITLHEIRSVNGSSASD